MTQYNARHRIKEGRQSEREEDRVAVEMKAITPMQRVLQERAGVVLGSVIPCALFYFLQLYLRRHRSPSRPTSSREPALQENPSSRTQPPHRSQSKNVFLSSMAIGVTEGDDSPYYVGWREYLGNPYDAESNPDGIIQLGLAESQLSLDLIGNWLTSHPEASSWKRVDRSSSQYQQDHELPAMKNAMAGFMGEVMEKRVSFDPSRIVLTAGATAAIEILGFCLAEAGNAFLVPSPYYPGFDRDIKWRSGVQLVPVPCLSTDYFNVTGSALEKAFSETKKRGVTVRALLISNPSNPVGHTLDSDSLCALLDFAMKKNIHLISDEIYAGSVYGSPRFTSVAEILASGHFDKSRVHIIYGLSKDLGLPGLKVGVLYSYNDKVMLAARRLSRFCSVSSQTQRLLIAMLSDTDFIEKYLSENRKRLGERYRTFTEGLQHAGIKCAKSNAALFCWVEMGHLMPCRNKEGELMLWKRLLDEVKLNVTPGCSCHCIEPGWFRISFASVRDHEMREVFQRFQKFCGSCNVRSEELLNSIH